MKTFFVKNNSYFDTNPYDTNKITQCLVDNKINEYWLEPDMGWSNQPDVVCFKMDSKRMLDIMISLNTAFKTEWIHVMPKDWRRKKYLQNK